MKNKDSNWTKLNAKYTIKPYLVKINYELKILDTSKSFSFSIIKYPQKSTGFDLFLSKIENAFKKALGLSCGILNKTTENIFSLGNFEESVKCQSLVINALCSDLENSASFPLESPFGLDIISNPCCARNTSSLFFTFSSLRNLTNGDGELDIVPASCEICSILKRGQDMFFANSWMVIEDFVNTHSSMEHLQNLPNHDPGAFKGRSSAAYFAVRYDVLVNFDSHEINHGKVVFKDIAQKIPMQI